MRFARGGYTIIEVIIVLAITGAIFTSATIIFRGKHGQTSFNQAMYDLESKIKSTVSDVQSGTSQASSGFFCREDNARPLVTTNPAGADKQDCIVLGRAVQLINNRSETYIYTVLGLRAPGGVVAETFGQTNPEPIFPTAGLPSTDFTVRYSLVGGARVLSSTANGQPVSLVGLYASPTEAQSVGQASSFLAKGYPIAAADNQQNSNGVKDCIRQVSAACQSPLGVSQWVICVQSANNEYTATLEVNVSSAGVSTKINFKDCS